VAGAILELAGVSRRMLNLATIAHQGLTAILGAQYIHQYSPLERKMELFLFFLKVSTQIVTVQGVAEGEVLTRAQQDYLTPHRHGMEGLQVLLLGDDFRKLGMPVEQQSDISQPSPSFICQCRSFL
jgi:hypothetical protein